MKSMTRIQQLKLNPGRLPKRDGSNLNIGAVKAIRTAAADTSAVAGLTHTFYRYPARFSPQFVRAALHHFSDPGDLVLDPYMGGGTTIVEAHAAGRTVVGCDLNSLAVFVTRAKVTPLNKHEIKDVENWARNVIPTLSYRTMSDELAELVCPVRTRNLSLPRARPTKKFIALALLSVKALPSEMCQGFARAVLLNAAQWALNNRKTAPSLNQLRSRVTSACDEMLKGLAELDLRSATGKGEPIPTLIHGTAEALPLKTPFVEGKKAKLVVTSPPYPGIHLLYHRWQVDGRKESPAPYWIANCLDGKGAAFYNFASRQEHYIDNYFSESLRTLRAIRRVLTDDAFMVQMIAFSNPRLHLPRYLLNMHEAGFQEVRTAVSGDYTKAFKRIWRSVPRRAWYAAQKGTTNSSREVVLIHRAR
jgi:DNA modification methylase